MVVLSVYQYSLIAKSSVFHTAFFFRFFQITGAIRKKLCYNDRKGFDYKDLSCCDGQNRHMVNQIYIFISCEVDTVKDDSIAKERKNSIFLQGSILAAAGIVTKIIGFLYRIPMANILGDQGNGLYSVAFGIYNIALTISSYGLPLAVSKLVSARLSKGQPRNAYRVFWDALLFALLAGAVAALVLWFGANTLAQWYKRDGLAQPLRILAPTTLMVALLAVFRGYFQGQRNMIPTAASQIVEQILNAIVSVVASYQFVRVYAGTGQQFAFGAMGGTLGTLAGAIAAFLVLLILFYRHKATAKGEISRDTTPAESNGHVYKCLILTVIPVILSQTVYQLGYTVDDYVYGNVMNLRGMGEALASSLQGIFNTQYNQMINLPVAIASAMAASTIPNIVSSRVNGRTTETFQKMDAVLKFNMSIAFPAAVGLAVLANPIITLLFPNCTHQDVAIHLLQFGSSAVVFYALSTITTALLQGSDYMRIPVYHSAISLGIHTLLIYLLLRFAPIGADGSFGVYYLLIGNVTFPMVVSLLNARSVSKRTGYHWRLKRTFLTPLAASLLMGAVVWISYFLVHKGMYLLCHSTSFSKLIGMLVSIMLGVAAYFCLILYFQCFTEQELLDLPFGRKILALGRKFR